MRFAVIILLASACGTSTAQRAAVATCTAATLATLQAKLPADDKRVLAVSLAAEETACILAALAALPEGR